MGSVEVEGVEGVEGVAGARAVSRWAVMGCGRGLRRWSRANKDQNSDSQQVNK